VIVPPTVFGVAVDEAHNGSGRFVGHPVLSVKVEAVVGNEGALVCD